MKKRSKIKNRQNSFLEFLKEEVGGALSLNELRELGEFCLDLVSEIEDENAKGKIG